tara:strand:+ start:132 stop:347 length:216 start_codon:yes stop_codon:yes gene_type:complete
MSTGIILGLGLASIVIVFYMMLNLPIWLKNKEFTYMKKAIKFLHNPNMVICIPIWATYSYGAYVFVLDLMK